MFEWKQVLQINESFVSEHKVSELKAKFLQAIVGLHVLRKSFSGEC